MFPSWNKDIIIIIIIIIIIVDLILIFYFIPGLQVLLGGGVWETRNQCWVS